jgi:hypothetical protein
MNQDEELFTVSNRYEFGYANLLQLGMCMGHSCSSLNEKT